MADTVIPNQNSKRRYAIAIVLTAALAATFAWLHLRSHRISDTVFFLDACLSTDCGRIQVMVPLSHLIDRSKAKSSYETAEYAGQYWTYTKHGNIAKASLDHWLPTNDENAGHSFNFMGFGYWWSPASFMWRSGGQVTVFIPIWFTATLLICIVFALTLRPPRITIVRMLCGTAVIAIALAAIPYLLTR